MVSAYMITWPSEFRAARPTVWIKEVSERRKPSLSASKMATSVISGISSPSLSRFMPTKTSNLSRRISRIMAALSKVSISEWRYLTLTFASCKYLVRSSAIFLVRVVTRILLPLSVSLWISESKSSICPLVGRTTISGSKSPVGRIICSALRISCSASYSPGVAETKSIWLIFPSNSLKFKGLLSRAEGRRNPKSTRVVFRDRFPLYIPRIWGRLIWLSSTIIR